jgi:glycerophosphoryl diester phosphodiesterase
VTAGFRSAWFADAPLVIAHRGASLRAPENTLAALRQAIQDGADAVELDVRLTRDGVPVVLHDASLERTTGVAAQVADVTLDQLRRLDAGAWFGRDFRGEGIPTLEEVLTEIAPVLLVDVELKPAWSPDGLHKRVREVIHRSGFASRVLVSSFDPRALMRFRRSMAHVPTGLLLRKAEPRWMRWALPWFVRPQFLNLEDGMLSLQRLRTAADAGRRILVWTVDDPERLRRLFEAGARGVITRAPHLSPGR